MEKEKYDLRYFEKETKYYSHVRPEIIRLIPHKVNRILDVGCSDGSFATQVLENKLCNEADGIEPFENAYLEAKNKLTNTYNGTVEDTIPFLKDNYYDIIFFNDVLEHLSDPEIVLRDFQKKLTKDGIIITSVPNVRYILNLYNVIFKKDWEYEESGVLDKTHLRFFTLKSFARLAQNAGYNLEYIGGNEETKIGFSGVKKLFNLIFFSFLKDTKYLQIISVLKPKN